MPFSYVLANLIARTDRCLGALFLDPSGETIELSCTEISPYQLRILGAYLGIHLRQLDRIAGSNALGEPTVLQIELDGLIVMAAPMPEGYYLVLVQRPPVRSAVARRELLKSAELLRQEAFAH